MADYQLWFLGHQWSSTTHALCECLHIDSNMGAPEQADHTTLPTDVDIDKVIDELEELEQKVSDDHERDEVRRVKTMLDYVPGTQVIHKYTTRDMGEAFIGGLVFSLPLLVEDGVFDIAEWFTQYTVGQVPLFLVANLLFIVVIAAGLLYAVDIREVRITNPFLGFIPRRLVGVLAISGVCAFGMMFLWGRLHEGDPSTLEAVSRGTVIWASAVLGAVLADILPGESKGSDIRQRQSGLEEGT